MRITALGALAVVAVIATIAVALVLWQDSQRNDDLNGPDPQNGNV
jgi:hypothetical protein